MRQEFVQHSNLHRKVSDTFAIRLRKKKTDLRLPDYNYNLLLKIQIIAQKIKKHIAVALTTKAYSYMTVSAHVKVKRLEVAVLLISNLISIIMP